MRKCLLPTALIALVILVLPGRAQEKPPEKPTDPQKKAEKPKPETALVRAMRRVKKVEDQKFMQMTVVVAEAEDNTTYIAVAEFGTGDFAIFQGGVDPDADQWIVFTKKDAEVLENIAHRQNHR